MPEESVVVKKNIIVQNNIAADERKINIVSLKVVRRDGSITPFKSEKISNAIKKAFFAQKKIKN